MANLREKLCVSLLLCISFSNVSLAERGKSDKSWLKSKEDYLSDVKKKWSMAYGFHGRDNNGMESYVLEGQGRIDEKLKMYKGTLMRNPSVLTNAIAECVFGTVGAYGDHIKVEDQKELMNFVFGEDRRYLKRMMEDYSFYKLINHPVDLKATGDDDCALMMVNKMKYGMKGGSDDNEVTLGRVFQSYMMD